MYPRRGPLRPLSLAAIVLTVILTGVFAFRQDNPTPRPAPASERGTQAQRGDTGERARAQQPSAPSARGWGPSVGFASRERWQEHFEKHGAEFGNITAEEYLRQAQALRDAAPGHAILEAVRADGVVTRFDRDSGAFVAVNRNGIIRTFFRPNDGERYFQRQKERSG